MNVYQYEHNSIDIESILSSLRSIVCIIGEENKTPHTAMTFTSSHGCYFLWKDVFIACIFLFIRNENLGLVVVWFSFA